MKNSIEDPNNIILIVGYMALNTLGRRIAEKQPEVKIFGDMIPLNAQVEELTALSAHADKFEMMAMFERAKPENIEHCFCVHGEEDALSHFSQCLKGQGMQNVHVPKSGDIFVLN